MEKTSYRQGEFCWADLATTDVARAKDFYSKLFGWSLVDMPAGPDMIYTMAQIDGKEVAAMSAMGPEQAGMPPHWNVYVAVDNVDASAERAKGLGGSVMMPPFDVFDAGRMAIVGDPAGAFLCLWQGKAHPGARRFAESGALCWCELITPDVDKASSFYSGLLGWSIKPSPEYTEFHLGQQEIGGMMKPDPSWGPVPPHWGIYFQVNDVDAVAAQAQQLGGQVVVPPTAVPTRGRFASLADPAGAHFSVYAEG